MNQSRLAWIPGLLAVMMPGRYRSGPSAGDPPSDQALAKVGLKPPGARWCPEAESEVHTKTTEAPATLPGLEQRRDAAAQHGQREGIPGDHQGAHR